MALICSSLLACSERLFFRNDQISGKDFLKFSMRADATFSPTWKTLHIMTIQFEFLFGSLCFLISGSLPLK